MNTTPEFIFLGNNTAVDFVNTEIILKGELIDLLPTPDELVRWTQRAGLQLDVSTTTMDHSDILDFRKSLRTLFSARIDNIMVPDHALTAVNHHLIRFAKREVLAVKEDEYFLKPAATTLNPSMLLEYLAYAGATLLASSQANRLKRCNNPDCVLMFVDTSRSQKRRWCSMETCGNRAKVSTHYKKQRSC
ncbi:MAG: CGNR zinc finger domain-containing protein [Chromatiales bacterium]|nr:CGNR zinc finger domain-containing protein [Chromatiales bacterium]